MGKKKDGGNRKERRKQESSNGREQVEISEEDKNLVLELGKADELFGKGAYDEGARIYDGVARKLYDKKREKEALGVYVRLAGILKQAGKWEESARIYEQIGDTHNAAFTYYQAARSSSGAKRGEYAELARVYYEKLTREMESIAEGEPEKERGGKEGGLEKEVKEEAGGRRSRRYNIAALFLITISSVFLIASNFTGYSVIDSDKTITNYTGIVILVIGLAILFFYLRKARREK